MPDAPEFLAREIELVPIGSIEPHPENPNKGDPEKIGESIDEVGFYSVIYVQKSSRRIIAGEHRWRALTDRGADAAPVVFLDVDDETALRIMVGDNELPRRHSRADDEALASILDRLAASPAGLSGTGLDDEDLSRLLADLHAPESFAPTPGANPRLDQLADPEPTVCPKCGHAWVG